MSDLEIAKHKHIGIYGYRPKTLLKFTRLKPSKEVSEKLEQLRALDNNIAIKMLISLLIV